MFYKLSTLIKYRYILKIRFLFVLCVFVIVGGSLNAGSVWYIEQENKLTTFAGQTNINGERILLNWDGTTLPGNDWSIEGYAFGTRNPIPDKRQRAMNPSRNQRQYQKGKLIFSEFTINNDYMEVICSGVFHPTDVAVVLMVNDKDVRSYSPKSGLGFLEWNKKPDTAFFDLRQLKGEKATIEVRDNHTNGYFNLVNIRLTDNIPASDTILITKAPDWLPDHSETTIQGDFLLLPVGPFEGTPLQAVKVEINGQEKLISDFPLAFGTIEISGYLPIYDLTDFQGHNIKVSFCSYEGFKPDSESVKILIQGKIPGRNLTDSSPAFHIHNRLGQLNDPNGLFYQDGVYHLFHQYTYNTWGLSWAHYASADLMHWEERPIVLFPDELGSKHSGSAVVDVLNTSGWQTGNTPPIVAAYTASRGVGGNDKIQMQGIAFSTNGAKTFTKFEDNPVLGKSQLLTEGSDNFRDPKFFWYSPTKGFDPYATDGHWVMVLFEGRELSMYSSKDLRNWEKHGSLDGFHECPELFPLAIDGDPKKIRWIMYGADGKYHIGEFNGKLFKPETSEKIPMYYGGKLYASQTFNNTDIGFGEQPRRIQVAWQGGRKGQMSTANELRLRNTTLGLRVCMLPVKEIENLYTRTENMDGLKLSPGDTNPFSSAIGGLYDLDFVVDLSSASQLVLTIGKKKLLVKATEKGLVMDEKIIPDTNVLHFRVLIDRTSIDVYFGEHGLYYFPFMNDSEISSTFSIAITEGEASFRKLQIHELKSIW